MKAFGLIVAAGRGSRAGGGLPKQYRTLRGEALLRRAARSLASHSDVEAVLVVINPDDRPLYDEAMQDVPKLLPPVAGGAERHDSVRAGLEALREFSPDAVLIHDAARPFVPGPLISDLLNSLQHHTGAFPALPVTDALWRVDGGLADTPLSRAGLFRAQTPQTFRFAEILAAHRHADAAELDDVAVARKAGYDVVMCLGSEQAFKVTMTEDFERAERMIGTQLDIRTGNGYDVHRYGPGDHVTLCGVKIPHDRGLVGHSDADVAMHTVTDAIFGALAEGDIGQWFPPSDPQWKGAASEVFLRKAVERARDRGYTITHVDCTIVCEAPRIGPHAPVMRGRLAEICGIELDRVSVKATTSEKLGFTGRGEGIAALGTATLVRS